MKIYRITKPSSMLKNALEKLLPQLSSSAQRPTLEHLENIFTNDNIYLLVAEIDGIIAGTLSLVIVDIPTGRKAWIEDVVVDDEFRGHKIGFELVEYAKNIAKNLNVKKIYLTSNPSRQAAHHLYKKCGFEEYDTTLFRILL